MSHEKALSLQDLYIAVHEVFELEHSHGLGSLLGLAASCINSFRL